MLEWFINNFTGWAFLVHMLICIGRRLATFSKCSVFIVSCAVFVKGKKSYELKISSVFVLLLYALDIFFPFDLFIYDM